MMVPIAVLVAMMMVVDADAHTMRTDMHADDRGGRRTRAGQQAQRENRSDNLLHNIPSVMDRCAALDTVKFE
jgi:hypothetical protein